MARLDALFAAGLEFAANLRSCFVYATEFVLFQKRAGFQERQRVHPISDSISPKKVLNSNPFLFDLRLKYHIILSGKYGKAAATGSAIHTIVFLLLRHC